MAGVPQFGKWDSEDNVPYTVYFEKARKNRGAGGKMINPNDPRENPEMFANSAFSAPDPPPPSRQRPQPEEPIRRPEEPIRRGVNRPAHQQRESREDNGEYKQQFSDSPARNRNGGRAGAGSGSDTSQHQYGGRGTGTGRPVRSSGGSEHSFERSPVHPQHQAKLGGRGNGSPAWEGKKETPHGTPSRTRMQPKSRDELPARHVIPEFGEWNDKDTQSADNYTYIFNQNAKKSSENTNPAPRQQIHHIDDKKSSQGCCFPWGRK